MKDNGHFSYVLRRSDSLFMFSLCVFLFPDCNGVGGEGDALADSVEEPSVWLAAVWSICLTPSTEWLGWIGREVAVSVGDMIYGKAITRCGAVTFFFLLIWNTFKCYLPSQCYYYFLLFTRQSAAVQCCGASLLRVPFILVQLTWTLFRHVNVTVGLCTDTPAFARLPSLSVADNGAIDETKSLGEYTNALFFALLLLRPLRIYTPSFSVYLYFFLVWI